MRPISPMIYDLSAEFLWEFFSDDLLTFWAYNDEFVQERRNSIANTLKLRLSCTNPWIRSLSF